MRRERGRPLDVAVVGAGLAGMCAALVAARAGCRVAVFDKAAVAGGRARSRERDGYHLNLGPHALYRGGAGTRVLRELGIALPGRPPSTAGGFALRAGAAHTFPAGALSLLTTGLLDLAGKLQLGRFLAALPSLDTAPLQSTTVDDWLARERFTERAAELLRALVRLSTYADDPARQSAGAALDQLRLAAVDNVLYLDGGWQTIVDGLRSALAQTGVEIRTGARVLAVDGAERVEAVRLAGASRLAARAVVMAVPPAEAARLVPEAAGGRLRRWSASATPVRAASLDLALAKLPRPSARFGLGIDQPLYFSVHSAAARLAPEGAALLHAARYLGSGPPGGAADRGSLERLVELLQPGWREHVAHARFLPELTVSHALVTADAGGVAGRPRPADAGIAGLYLAGDWVGDAGLLADASLASGRRAGGLAAAHCARTAAAA